MVHIRKVKRAPVEAEHPRLYVVRENLATKTPAQPLVTPGGRAERLLASIFMGIGIGLRLAQYLGHRSLWGDEVSIALNLRLHSFAELLHPLSYDQTMPLGLLFVLKIFGTIFGYSEWVLRLPLLLAGCALVVLAWFLYARLIGQRVALMLVALLAVYQPLIYYSNEAKQYGFDALVTLLVVWLAIRMLKADTDRGWPQLMVGGTVAMLFSQPIIFVLGGIGAAGIWDRRFRTSARWRIFVILAGVIWAAMFAVLFWFSYRHTSHSDFMRAYWDPKLIHIHSARFLHELAAAVVILLAGIYSGLAAKVFLCFLFAVGLVGIRRQMGSVVAVMAAIPFLLTLLAASLQQYPLVVRLALFLAPILFWTYASGLSLMAGYAPRSLQNVVFVVLASALFITTAWQARHLPQREGSRDIARKIAAAGPAQAVYLVFGHYLPWEYYAGDWNQAEMLKQRVDRVAGCIRLAQLGYAQRRHQWEQACTGLQFPASGNTPAELVGVPPPGPWEGGAADNRWAKSEARKIASMNAPVVWLFLSDQANHFTYGFPERRKLMEKLQMRLRQRGCQLLEVDAEAETRASKLQCPQVVIKTSGN